MNGNNIQNSGGGCLAAARALSPVPTRPTDEVLSQISSEQECTHGLLARLTDRLEKVLSQAVTDQKLGTDPMPCSTPLAEALDRRRLEAVVINQRLQHLLDRIVL